MSAPAKERLDARVLSDAVWQALRDRSSADRASIDAVLAYTACPFWRTFDLWRLDKACAAARDRTEKADRNVEGALIAYWKFREAGDHQALIARSQSAVDKARAAAGSAPTKNVGAGGEPHGDV